MSAPVVAVAALGRNGVIGGGGKLPWRLPTDLKHFKATTLGKPMIMGRKTFESIGRPLPGRETIVVTRDGRFQAPPGVHVVASPDAALALARDLAAASGAAEIVLAGGGQLYRALLEQTDRLRLTLVDLSPEGDAHFPTLDPGQWVETARETPPRAAGDDAECIFVTYERKRQR